MPHLNRFPIGAKLAAGFAAVLLLLVVLGVASLGQLSSVSAGAQTFNDDIVPSISKLDDVGFAADSVRQDQYRHTATPTAADMVPVEKDLKAATAAVEAEFADYEKMIGDDTADRGRYDAARSAWAAYLKASQGFLPFSRNNDPRAYATLEAADAQWDAFSAKLDEWAAGNDATAEQINRDADATYASGRTITIVLLLVATLIAVAVAFFLARSIGRGLRSMVAAAKGLSVGDVDQRVDIRSRDEIGDMATAFEQMIDYNREMAAAAQKIAEGDLTGTVEPKGETDALGNAFADMTLSLRGLVGDVAASAGTLKSASVEMAATSDEAGRAVGEIAPAGVTSPRAPSVRCAWSSPRVRPCRKRPAPPPRAPKAPRRPPRPPKAPAASPARASRPPRTPRRRSAPSPTPRAQVGVAIEDARRSAPRPSVASSTRSPASPSRRTCSR